MTVLRSLLILTITFCCSCSDYAKQENTTGARQQSPETRLTLFGLSLAKKNADDFYSAVEGLNKALESECASSRILSNTGETSAARKTYETVLRKFYLLQGFALGNQKTDDTQAPLNDIYYRTLNRCLLDTIVLDTKNKQPLSPASFHASVSGLSAIEYLLFDKKMFSSCNKKAYPQMEQWNQLPESEKKKDRCFHAQVLGQRLQESAQKIVKDWTPQSAESLNNLKALEYTKSEAIALKNMVQAISYLEKVKDFELGKPLGQNSLCTNETGKCPEDIQHVDSQLSLVAVISSLESFQQFLNGINPTDYSIKSYLQDKNQNALAEQINSAVEQALDTANNLNKESTLLQLVENMNPVLCQQTTIDQPVEPVCFLFKQVESITKIYKSDLLTFMSLEINHSIPQGDND